MEAKQVLESVSTNDNRPEGGPRAQGRGQLGERFHQLLAELMSMCDAEKMCAASNSMPVVPAAIEVKEREEQALVEEGAEILQAVETEEIEEAEDFEEQVQVEVEEQEVETEEQEVKDEEVVVEEQDEEEEQVLVQEEVVKELETAVEAASETEAEVVSETEAVAAAVSEGEPSAVQTEASVEQQPVVEKVEAAEKEVTLEESEKAPQQDSLGKEMLTKREHNTQLREQKEVEPELTKELDKPASEELLKEVVRKPQGKQQAEVKVKPTADSSTGSEEGPRAMEVATQWEAVAPEAVQPKINRGEAIKQALSQVLPGVKLEAVLQQGSGNSGSQGQSNGNGNLGFGSANEKALGAKGKKVWESLPRETGDKTVEKVKDLLKTAARNRSGNTLVVRLDPPRLGNITLKVTHKAGQVFARIVPDSAEIEGALRSRVPELLSVLTANGFNRENVHVSIGTERSESEMYQFNDFLEKHQGRNRGEGEAAGAKEKEEIGFLNEQGVYQKPNSQVTGWVA